MSFFWESFRLQLRRLLRRGGLVACLLVLPLLALALGLLLPADAGDDAVTVGVYAPAGSEAGAEVLAGLIAYSDADVRFVAAGSVPEMEGLVAAGVWECGYILPQDLDGRIEAGRYARLVTRVEAPGTTLAPLLDWMVAASLLDACAPDIAEEYLLAAGVATAGDLENFASRREGLFEAGALMEMELLPVAGRPTAGQPAVRLAGAAMVRGLTALLLLLFTCLCSVRFSEDITSGFFARLRPHTGPARLFFPFWCAAGLLAGLAGLLALAVAGRFFPAAYAPLWQEALLLVLYLLLLAAFSFALSALFARREGLVAVLPFLLLASLLLCPIVVDLSQFILGGRVLASLLPPTLYLRAAAGEAAALWQMPAATLGLLVLGLLLMGLRTPRHSNKKSVKA